MDTHVASSGPSDPQEALDHALWSALSRTSAQEFSRDPCVTSGSAEDRVARARCQKTLQLYEPAWNELAGIEPQLPPGRLRARVRSDLLVLSYYLARPIDERTFAESIEREAGSDLRILADLHLGLSLRATARNELHTALREAYFCLDVAKEASRESGEVRALMPALRLRAHLLAQGGSYREAFDTADEAVALARDLDAWELGWTVYTKGFVLWCQGRAPQAIHEFDEALRLTGSAETSLPRWIRASRSRALAMLGRIAEAELDLAASSYQLPEDVAYISIVRGEPSVAVLALEPHLPAHDPFVLALHGIAQVLLGHNRRGEQDLLAAHEAFAAGGLLHYALSVSVHLAFGRAQRRLGSGRVEVHRAAAEMVSRGAFWFAWPHQVVTTWVARIIRDDPRLGAFARGPDAPLSDPPLAVRLHERGLTDRETGIAVRIMELHQRVRDATTTSRTALAADLDISGNTLRVHLMRIKEKLGVAGHHGDADLIRVLETWTDDGLHTDRKAAYRDSGISGTRERNGGGRRGS